MQLIWLIPLMPLLGFLINGLLSGRLPKPAVGYIACGSVLASLLLSIYAVLELMGLPAEARVFELSLYSWIPVGSFNADFGFLLDPLSAVMILVVSGVGFLIHIYSIGYMAHDRDYSRFFTYMNLFTGAMLILVLANNFVLMYVGWEGVGLCSYLLIGFWYERKSASDAGKKAFIVNRIGDFGFSLGIFLLFWHLGTVNFAEVMNLAPEQLAFGGGIVTAATLLLFLGATGKSAQVPLYVWLPDAMEGPTPVSALIHAATMVTAGVYMVARCNVIFMMAPTTLLVVALIGLFTAIFAATIGLFQNDIKRVLAYSTVSQLGYMFLACGVAAFGAGIFHLMTHAFFKALLFLGAGSVIHGMSDEQDMRKMGGLKDKMPTTFWTMMIATLAIAGIPPLAGFVSKDEILWQSFSSPFGSPIFWVVAVLTAGLTAFYMFRLIFMTFYGKARYDHHTAEHVHESPKVMTVPLMVLAVLSVIGGLIGWPAVLGGGAWFEHFLHPVFAPGAEIGKLNEAGHYSHAMEYLLIVSSIVLVLIAILAARRLYLNRVETDVMEQKLGGVYQLIYHKYYVDELYDKAIVTPCVNLSVFLWQKFDVLVIDGIVNGSAWLLGQFSGVLRKAQTGMVRGYAFIFLAGVVFVVGYLLLNR
ncbi:MAG: NADH-quinone oxidoreductase subunit L [candidate division Zixibacteria bacterium]|nr:NADH-quinone oxidoreductase subunit L [candidate division Zixibacteria bacterium]